MSELAEDRNVQLRRSVYAVLIALAVGSLLGRILAVESVDQIGLEQTRVRNVLGPHSSIGHYLEWKRKDLANQGFEGDALEDELQRARRIKSEQLRDARLRRPFLSANDRSRWCTLRALVEPDMRVEGAPYSIDKVTVQQGWDTIDMVKHDGHLYSSKPPLYPTFLAGAYWLIYNTTGWSLADEPYLVGRILLISVNLLPLLLYFWLIARLIERFGTSDWGRIFVMAAAALGTLLTTFAVVLNNHLPAAASTVVALYVVVRIWLDNERRLRYFVIAGLAAAFCVANELPSAALAGLLSLGLLWKAPKQTLLGYAPAALLVAAGFFGTNWIAHESLRPPYMHRSETDPADNWYDYEYQRDGRVIESYWRHRVGIDLGEPSVVTYALHVLVGHHGIFSLTPVWLLSVVGLGLWLWKPPDSRIGELALLIAVVSVICLVFYLVRPQDDRNYGGMTCGFRWMFWFAPMWLMAMVPAADALARRTWTRGLGLVFLAVSVLSATYPTWNPWTHPWLLNFLHYLGWITV